MNLHNINESGHSFAILAYKESPYLEDCIISLRKQTVTSKIFISTSTPSKFLDKISEKFGIPLIVNLNRKGIGSDWTFAYDKCRTKYLTLAHQDDIYLPDYTENCLALGRRNDNLITFTDYSELIDDKIIKCFDKKLVVKRIVFLPFFINSNVSSSLIRKMLLFFGNPISCPSVMYNKDNIGDFRFSDKFLCSLDWEAWIELAKKKGGFAYVKKKLIIHRIYQDSQSALLTSNKLRQHEEELILQGLWPKPFAKILKTFLFLFQSPIGK